MLGATYFLLQGIAVIAWWLGLAYVSGFPRLFLPVGALDSAFIAFAAPDVVVLALGSIITAALSFRGRPSARIGAWLTTGAVAYAAVYTVTWTALVDAPRLSAALMLAAMVLSVWCARRTV